MNLNFLKNHGDLAKGFRYIKPDGDDFIYYPHPNFKGFKAHSVDELHKIIVNYNSVEGLMNLSFFYVVLLFFIVILKIFILKEFSSQIIIFLVVSLLIGTVIVFLSYSRMKKIYDVVEPEVKTIKETLGKYYFKTTLISVLGLVLYFFALTLIVPYLGYGIFLENKDYPKALKVINLIQKIKPNNYSIYTDRAMVKSLLGNQDGALDDYDKAIQLNPEKANLYSYRADQRYKIKDYQGALSDYNKAISMQKDSSCYVSRRGLFYYKRGKYTEALKDFDMAYEKSGDDWNLFSKGLVKEAQNNYCGALKEYNSIKEDKNMNDLKLHKAHAEYRCYGK